MDSGAVKSKVVPQSVSQRGAAWPTECVEHEVAGANRRSEQDHAEVMRCLASRRVTRQAISEGATLWRTWERDAITHVSKSGGVGDGSFKSKAKSSVRH